LKSAWFSTCQPDAPEDDLETLIEDDLEPESEPAQDDPLPRRAMEFVERSPGERTAAIADALGVTTAPLAPTLRIWCRVGGSERWASGGARGTS